MSRISSTFADLKQKGEGALIAFVTAGDPSLEELPSILEALAEGGADLIEVGIPFSDPIADGPTIQASSQRALDRGVTPIQVLEALAQSRAQVPVVVMGYLNPMMAMGLDRFASLAKQGGVDGVIVCDLTPDQESEAWDQAAEAAGLDRVYLAAPTSTPDRLAAVARKSTGFVYAVSRTGVTGAGSEAPAEVSSLVQSIRSHSDLPVAVGFGISKPEHVRRVCQAADGAVVGSLLVDLLNRTWNRGAGREEFVAEIQALKEATR